MAGTSYSSRRPIVRVLIAWTIALASPAPALAQTPNLPVVPDSALASDSLVAADTAAIDSLSLMGPVQSLEDTSWTRFVPPDHWRSDESRALDLLLAGPTWPMPPVDAIAGGDLVDWLTYHPAYDVDDAPGVGQTRFFTHWGLVDRTGDWQVDGRNIAWQRLTFPMTPQFDPAILPSFNFAAPHFGEKVVLQRDTSWGERPIFDYTFRQGDFSDTYSEGIFRAHTKRGFGLNLGAVFFSSDGRYSTDNRDKRIITVETFGPLRKQLYWRARYDQFRDKSAVLTPAPFDFVHPGRNDLLWSGEIALGHVVDSGAPWELSGRFQHGDQRLLYTQNSLDSLSQLVRDTVYSIDAGDYRWDVRFATSLAGWQLDADAGREGLDIDSIDAARWFMRIAGARLWHLNDRWSAALSAGASDYEGDGVGFEGTAALKPNPSLRLLPRLRLARERVTPTLFDLERPLIEEVLIGSSQGGLIYSESGDPTLDDQWDNSINVQWGAERIFDSVDFDWTVGGHAAYIENYTAWSGPVVPDSILGLPVTHYAYRPRQADARSLGAAIGVQGRAVWKLHYFANYTVKYVTDLDNHRLTGYYPHKGSAMLSLIAPKWKFGVDMRLNVAGLWWYGDKRIDPSGYETPHVFRLDLSGSARVVGDLTIYALMQNVANFPYRTAAGYPFTGRTVRFGFHVTLFD